MQFNQEEKILIIGQHLTSRTESIRDYLLPRAKQLFVIALGGAFIEDRQNYLFCYEGGRLKKQILFRHPLLKNIIRRELIIALTFYFYVYDILRVMIECRSRFALCIGISHFSGIISLLLKKTFICRKNIYYAIDYYAPVEKGNIFESFVLRISNFIDKLSVFHSDEVWDISCRVAEGRAEFGSIEKESYGYKNKIAPLGFSKNFFRSKNISQIDKYAIVFVGVIVKGQGLELLLETLPEIIEIMPGIKIKVIGDGPFLHEFRHMVAAGGMERFFVFFGFIEKEEELLEAVSSCALGISVWDRRINSLNFYYGDPGKTKLYTVCGLPVVVSRDTFYSQVIIRHKAGVAIGYDKDELLGALRTVLSDAGAYAVYKSNAMMVAKDHCDSEKILSEVLKQA